MSRPTPRRWWPLVFNAPLTRAWRRDRPGDLWVGIFGPWLIYLPLLTFWGALPEGSDPAVSSALRRFAWLEFVGVALLMGWLMAVVRTRQLRRYVAAMLAGRCELICPGCGYPWRHGHTGDRPTCPECGTPRPQGVADF